MRRFGVIIAISVLSGAAAFGDDACTLPPDSGSCPTTTTLDGQKEEIRYYYSVANLKCTEFPYSGCKGNENNFKTLEECKSKCQKSNAELPLIASIIAAQAQQKCYYGNRTYAVRDPIPEATTDSSCSMGCFCHSFRPSQPPRITCATVDCAPYPDTDGEMDCVPIHKEGSCCPEYYCPSQAKPDAPKPHQCVYRNQTYVEGQTIYPDDLPCITCTCSKAFKGYLTTEGGVCREVNCGIQIHHQSNLINRCVPKFYTTSGGRQSCCPIEWNCQQHHTQSSDTKTKL
jgi:tissue factor pathway inhibitor